MPTMEAHRALILCIKKESFDATEDDALINPAHALLGTLAREKDLAEAFVDWLSRKDGGQKVIGSFSVRGTVLYSPVARGARPLQGVHLQSKL